MRMRQHKGRPVRTIAVRERSNRAPHRNESVCGALERLVLLAERKPHERPPHLAIRVEARPRNRCDADLLTHPLREGDVVLVTQRGEIREDIIRTFRLREGETRFGERVIDRTEDVASWAARVDAARSADRATPILVYIRNFYEGHAPASANKLKRLLGEPIVTPEDLEDQPSLF